MDESGDITFRCRTCRGDVARARIGSEPWTHCDDEIVTKGLSIVSLSKYDHPADPDIIDVSSTVKQGGASTNSTSVFPFFTYKPQGR